jgi:mono/diheme cytochrome c family protein
MWFTSKIRCIISIFHTKTPQIENARLPLGGLCEIAQKTSNSVRSGADAPAQCVDFIALRQLARRLQVRFSEKGQMPTRILMLLLIGTAIGCAQGSDQKAPSQKEKAKVQAVNYYRDIEPILNASCVSCHQASMAAGGLRLDAPEGLLQGGASGKAVIPGKAELSLLYTRLTVTTDKGMPPVGTVSDEQLALIRAWINLGAKIGPAPPKR